MPEYRVTLTTTSPIYCELYITADDEADARIRARRKQHALLIWKATDLTPEALDQVQIQVTENK